MTQTSSVGAWASFMRVLFPAWKFFVEVDDQLLLECRWIDLRAERSWEKVFPPPPRRKIGTLFLNADGNLLFACQTAVERLVNELGERKLARPEDLLGWPSYEIVRNVVLAKLRETNSIASSTDPRIFQFRISNLAVGAAAEQAQELLVSDEHEV